MGILFDSYSSLRSLEREGGCLGSISILPDPLQSLTLFPYNPQQPQFSLPKTPTILHSPSHQFHFEEKANPQQPQFSLPKTPTFLYSSLFGEIQGYQLPSQQLHFEEKANPQPQFSLPKTPTIPSLSFSELIQSLSQQYHSGEKDLALGADSVASKIKEAMGSEYAYAKLLEFEKSKRQELQTLQVPTRFSQKDTGLSRTVTYVPGKGLMIHLKGKRRNLLRRQIGTQSGQGVVTLAVCFDTGAFEAFKSMKCVNVDKKVLDIHKILKNFPNEFASGSVVEYLGKDQSLKIGIFMPYITGGDLWQVLWKNYIEIPKQISYALGLAKSLSHLHHLGFLHRDLKPDNILVSPEGSVVLADFDLAVQKGSEERYHIQGNRWFMAPEVFSYYLEAYGKCICPELCQQCTLVNCVENFYINFSQLGLTEQSQFENTSIADTISAFKKLAGTEISEKSEVFSVGMILHLMRYRDYCYTWPQNPDDTPDAYEKLIKRCLQLHPDNRPTMNEVIQELQQLVK